MAVSIKSIKDGAVSAGSLGDLVDSVAAGKTLVVKNMRFVNTGSASATLNVYFKHDTDTSRRIVPKDTVLPAGYSLVDDQEITLEEDDKIEGQVESGETVDYVISGIEREVV